MIFGKWEIKVVNKGSGRNKVSSLALVNESDKIIIDIPSGYYKNFGYDIMCKKVFRSDRKAELFEIVNEILTNHIVWITSMRASPKTIQNHLLKLAVTEKVETTKIALVKVAKVLPSDLLTFKKTVFEDNEAIYDEISKNFN